MRRTMSKPLFHVTLMLLFCMDTVFGDCYFPSYTNNYPRWETRISLERRLIGAYWMFNQSTAEFTDLTKIQTSYMYDCDSMVNSTTFIMKLDVQSIRTDQSSINKGPTQNDDMVYMCAVFSEHSSTVLQLKLSPLSMFSPPGILCGGNYSAWDDQILLWPQMDNYEPCPIVGGFQFSMTDYSMGIRLCSNSFLPPIFESECLEDEGMHIDFRNFYCRGGLGMQLDQRLSCLGSWREGNFTYSVVTDMDTTWPRMWLFRFPVSMDGDQFDVELLTEIKVVSTPINQISSDHYTLHLKRKMFLSTCEDDANQCTSNCSTNSIVVFCQKSCNACVGSQPGNFSSNATGNWIQFSMDGMEKVTVATSIMSIGNVTFSCINLPLSDSYMTKDRKPMALIFTNGCRPRYLCADFVRRSRAVLQYRLSQYVAWPHAQPMTGDDLCSESQFSVTKSLPTTDLNSHKYKTLVRSDKVWPEVSCGFGLGYFHLTAHFPSGEICKALINSCDSKSNSSFDVVLSDDCYDHLFDESQHRCIATFTDDTSGDLLTINRFMITEDFNSERAYCWFLHKEQWDSWPRLFLTYAADCNSDIAMFILNKDYTGYLAYFDISPGPGLLGSYSCSEDASSWFNASTTLGLDGGMLGKSTIDAGVQVTASTKDQRNPQNVNDNVQAPVQDPNRDKNNGQISAAVNYTFAVLQFYFALFLIFAK